METFSALLALCAGNSPDTSGFPSRRPVTRKFDVLFDLCLKKRLSKQSRRHCTYYDVAVMFIFATVHQILMIHITFIESWCTILCCLPKLFSHFGLYVCTFFSIGINRYILVVDKICSYNTVKINFIHGTSQNVMDNQLRFWSVNSPFQLVWGSPYVSFSMLIFCSSLFSQHVQ